MIIIDNISKKRNQKKCVTYQDCYPSLICFSRSSVFRILVFKKVCLCQSKSGESR